MKKLFYLGLTAILAAFTFTACGGGETTPGAAAKKYTQYMIDGKYDAFVDAIAFDEDETPEKIEQGKVMFKALLSEKVEKEFAKKGGVTNSDVYWTVLSL